GQRHNSDRLDGAKIEAVRIYDRALSAHEVGLLAGARLAATSCHATSNRRAGGESDKLFSWWLRQMDSPSRELADNLAALVPQESTTKEGGTLGKVMHEGAAPAMAFLLFRGEYDNRRDPVKPQTPSALPPMPRELPRNRLGLAM